MDTYRKADNVRPQQDKAGTGHVWLHDERPGRLPPPKEMKARRMPEWRDD